MGTLIVGFIRELRQWIFRLTIGMSVGFISVLSAILVRGA